MAENWQKTGINLRGSSVLGCGRWKNYGSDSTIAEVDVKDGVARMSGHFQCKNQWSCDHCARARVSQTRSWIRAALIPAMDKAGLCGALLTFTLAHNYDDDWAGVVGTLYKAFSLFDRRMAKVYKKIGSQGKLKSLEAPIGSNGLHPHLHVLLTYEKGVDLAGIDLTMRLAWARAVSEAGGRTNQHGFDFKPDCVNDYAAKLETSHEMSSHGTKTARNKGLLLGQLLDRSSKGDEKAGREWLRALVALGGKMRFHAGGLPKKLGIDCPSKWEDDADDDLSEVGTKQEVQIRIVYSLEQHLQATAQDTGRPGLAIILRSARSGGQEKVRRTVLALIDDAARRRAHREAVRPYLSAPPEFWEKILANAVTQRILPHDVPLYLEARARSRRCSRKVSPRMVA